MLSIERIEGTGDGVFALDSNSLSRSETTINLFKAIWEAVSAILALAGVTLSPGV